MVTLVKTIIVAFCTLILFSDLVIAQINGGEPMENFQDKIMPPSPEPSLLHRYIEVPVSNYTGVPDINIALLDISDGNLSVPVSLSYHAAGNKVEDVSTFVGLGWSLRAGGMVSRVIRGVPDDDETREGFLKFIKNEGMSIGYLVGGDASTRWVWLDRIARGCADPEPDEFYFNFNGFSGKFAFDWDGTLKVSSSSKVVIEPIFKEDIDTNPILGWKIIVGDGTVYKFMDIDYMTLYDLNLSCGTHNPTYASSWYLTEISSLNSENSINFEYEPYPMDYEMELSEMKRHNWNPQSMGCSNYVGNSQFSKSHFSYSGKRMSRIFTKNKFEIKFDALTQRKDIVMTENQPVLNALSQIVYSDFNGTVVKKYNLNHDNSSGRLTLKSIEEKSSGGDTVNSIKRYIFDYNSISLPDRKSKKQDHWGYYNNNSYNSLVPPTTIKDSDSNIIVYEGGDRSPSPKLMKAGILERITYPTGGYTEFSFEPHTYIFTQDGSITEYADTLKQDYITAVGYCNLGGTICGDPVWIESNEFEVIGEKESEYSVPKSVVNINWSFSLYTAREDYFGAGRGPLVEIVDEEGVRVFSASIASTNDLSGSAKIVLNQGKYKLRARAYWKEGNSFDRASISYQFYDKTNTLLKEKIAGGLRVKKISDYTSSLDDKPIIRNFSYKLSDGRSSGVIYAEPQYEYTYTYAEPNGDNCVACGAFIRLARNKSVLGATQGSHIGYQSVTVNNLSEEGNGKVVYQYTTPLQYRDVIYTTPPFAPPTSHSYKTGQLLAELAFNNENDSILEKHTTPNYYEEYVSSLKVGWPGCTLSEESVESFDLGPYRIKLGHSQTSEIIEIQHSLASESSLEKRISNFYDAKLQNLIRQESQDSNHGISIRRFFYPEDYTLLPSSHPIKKMGNIGMTSIPIEVVSSKKDGEEEKVVSATLYEFDEIQPKGSASQAIKLSKVYKAELEDPVGLFDYSINQDAANLKKSYPDDEEISYPIYDSKGNLCQYTKQGKPVSYIWGYNQLYPVAMIDNANYDQIEAILGVGFDLGDGPLNDSQILALKSGLATSIITTYTYQPGIGLQSQTDPTGKTTYYKYDDFGRLLRVYDNSNNILQQYEYKYASESN